MKKLYCILAYLTIISQIINIDMPILSLVIGGYTVKYIFFYSFIGISIAIMIVKVLTQSVKPISFMIFIFTILPFFTSLLYGYSIMSMITESVLFLMPLSVYIFAETVNLKLESYIKILSFTSIVGAVLSILVSMRIIETDIWAADGSLVRAAGAIDSSLFILGLIVFTIRLFVYPQSETAKIKIMYYASWISCIIGTIFSQSRVRIVLMLFVLVFPIAYNLLNKKSKYGSLKLIAIGSVFLIIVFSLYSDLANQILSQVSDRFGTVGSSDVNIFARQTEITQQLDMFFKNPILGAGWGSRAQLDVYAHNVYSTVLMQTGIIGGIIYICWLLYPLKVSFKSIKTQGKNVNNLASFLIVAALLVLGYTNAGILQSGGYMCALYVFICMKDMDKSSSPAEYTAS